MLAPHYQCWIVEIDTLFVCMTLRRSRTSPLEQQSTIHPVHIGNRWYQVVIGWSNFGNVVFLSGIALTSTSILEEEFFLIYQIQAMTNM